MNWLRRKIAGPIIKRGLASENWKVVQFGLRVRGDF